MSKLPLAKGREHLTAAGEFRSDKYEWCKDGFLPLRIYDEMAWPMLRAYADARRKKDAEFSRDLHEALDNAGALPATEAEKIWTVHCQDFPKEVEKYVEEEMGHNTHGSHSVAGVSDDGNIFAEWLKTQGADFEGKDWMWVALFAT